jgi:hypothetical protein
MYNVKYRKSEDLCDYDTAKHIYFEGISHIQNFQLTFLNIPVILFSRFRNIWLVEENVTIQVSSPPAVPGHFMYTKRVSCICLTLQSPLSHFKDERDE